MERECQVCRRSLSTHDGAEPAHRLCVRGMRALLNDAYLALSRPGGAELGAQGRDAGLLNRLVRELEG